MGAYLQQSLSPLIGFGNSGILKPTSAITISVWVYRTSAARHTLWCNYYTAHPVYSGAILDILNDGTVYFWFGIGSDFNSGHIRGTTSTVSTGVWHHIAVTWEANAQAKIYIDGVEATYTGLGNVLSAIVYNASNNTEVGILRVGATPYYRSDMYLADLRLYNQAVSDGFIQSIVCSQGGDMLVDGLIGRWLMDGVLTDISGSAINGTGTNISYVPAPLRLVGARHGRIQHINR